MRLFFTFLLFSIAGNSIAQCFKKVYTGELHFIAISQDGSLWGWGDNGSYQLGDGTLINKPTPVLISSAAWLSASCGLYHTMAIKTDGTLWGWGSDLHKQLGNGTDGPYFTPQQIGTANDWKEVVAGELGTVAIKNDGTLWSWGSNTDGYLGNGEANGYETDVPVQAGTDTNWKHIAGNDGRHCLALKTDGSLWAWGHNHKGQLGDGTGTDSYTPIRIGTDTDWKWIDAGSRNSFALKNDNTLWAWGFCNSGFPLDTAVPLQIGSDSNWDKVSVKKYEGRQYVLMTKTNGTLWAWGNDDFQQLGNGVGYTDYATPTQIGSDTNWTDVAAGYSQSSATKSDGTFWAWGDTMLISNSSLTPEPAVYNCVPMLAVGDFQKDLFSLYPNPVTNILYFSDINPLAIKIYDMNGRQYQFAYDAETKSIVVEQLSSGVYIISIQVENTVLNRCFVKN